MAGSPIFRRITLTEVKKASNKRGSLLRELAGLEKEEKDIIKNHHDPSYSNWRSSFLIEGGMTTKGFMQTTFPAEGDTDLDSIDSTGDIEQFPDVWSNSDPAGPSSWPTQGVEILSSGSGSGDSGGFDIGTDYLGVNNAGSPVFNAINLDPIDCTRLDEIVITGIRGNGSNGGTNPADYRGAGLDVSWQSPETLGGTGYPMLTNLWQDAAGNVMAEGTANELWDEYGIIIPSSASSTYDPSHTGLREWTLPIPSWVRGENITFTFMQVVLPGEGLNFGITKIAFRRKSPITVFVSLDSPEASSFMRIGSPSRATQSKKKREKQLREQLEASKDYTDKKFGENFPGSETPPPGEEDPTEQAKRAPGLGEFEPEVVDYNTWKQETKKEDPKAKTTPKEYEKWKDDKKLKSFAAVRDAQGKKEIIPPSPTSDKKDFDTFSQERSSASAEYTGTPEQQEDLYKDLTDLFDTDPNRAQEIMQQVEDNPEYIKIQDEVKELQDILSGRNTETKYGAIGNEGKPGTVFYTSGNTAADAAEADYEALEAKHKAEEDKRWDAMSSIKMFTTKDEGTLEYTPAYEKALTAYNKFQSANRKEAGALYTSMKDIRTGQRGYKDIPSVDETRNRLKTELSQKIEQSIAIFDKTLYNALQNPQISASKPGDMIAQKDFSSIAQLYGGQGVDAATLASTAAELEKKKARAAASLPELEKLVARTSKAEKEAYDELKMAALDYGMDVVSVISAVGSGGLSLLPAAIRKVAGKKLVKKVLNKFKTTAQKKKDRTDFANRMQQDVGNPTGTSDTRNLTGRDNAFQKFQKQEVKKLKKGDPTLDQLDRYRKNEKLPSLKKKNLKNSYKPKGSMIIEKRNLKSPNQFFNADDIKPDYPKDPPPDMVDGKWHPDLVDSARKAERFNKLDPASAKAMPKTGDPNIDAKVEKAKNNPDKDGPEWHKKVTDKIKNRNA